MRAPISGARPAMRHGTAIVGATLATMRKVNKMASKVSGKTSGARSNFARQTLSGFNPAHKVFLDPLVAWTRALWDGVLNSSITRRAWTHALKTAGCSSTPIRAAEGAAGAYIGVLCFLGWAAPQPDHIWTDELDAKGNRVDIDLKKVCPRVVLMMAQRRMAELDAASSRLAARIGAVPDLEPLASIVRSKEQSHSTALLSLKAMGEGGWRTQADLF